MPCDSCGRSPSCSVCDGCFPKVVLGVDVNSCPRKCRCTDCSYCGGSGFQKEPVRNPKTGELENLTCGVCHGEGLVRAKP